MGLVRIRPLSHASQDYVWRFQQQKSQAVELSELWGCFVLNPVVRVLTAGSLIVDVLSCVGWRWLALAGVGWRWFSSELIRNRWVLAGRDENNPQSSDHARTRQVRCRQEHNHDTLFSVRSLQFTGVRSVHRFRGRISIVAFRRQRICNWFLHQSNSRTC